MVSSDDGEGPVCGCVDVDGFEFSAFVHHGLVADAGVRLGEALAGEEVEVGVLFEPGLEVLGADEVGGVVIHRGAVGAVEARLNLVDGEQGVCNALGLGLLEGVEGAVHGVGLHEGVGGVGHEIDVSFDAGDIVGEDEVHGDEVAAKLGLAVADGNAVGVIQAVLGEDVAGVRIDDDLIDLFHRDQCVENPAEQGFAAKVAEVFAFDP